MYNQQQKFNYLMKVGYRKNHALKLSRISSPDSLEDLIEDHLDEILEILGDMGYTIR